MSEHRYEKIAAALREEIETGSLGWGAQLPTQERLQETYGASRPVVRQALDILEGEGLIDRVRGGGAFVRRYQPLVRRPSLHYKSDPGAPFAEEALAAERLPTYRHRTAPDVAEPEIARRLHCPTGAPVMRTDYASSASGDPMMLTTSYEPLAITKGTPIERPEEGPLLGAGLVERFTSIGLRPTAVVERLRCRMPRPSEREALDLRPGTPIVLITRATYCGDTVLETADIRLDAHHYDIEYVTTVSPIED